MTRIEQSGGEAHWLDRPGGIRVRAASWNEGRRGVVLLLNGRGEYIEKHLETIGDLRTRGFAVWTLDWRGQGFSTRLLPDRFRHHVERFDDYSDDLDALIDTAIVPALDGRPFVLLAHSMGGHMGALLLARRGSLFARAILSAPMIDFLRGGAFARMAARTVMRLACLSRTRREQFGPGTVRAPRLTRAFEGNNLTSCPERFAHDLALLNATPEAHLGGCTWGWLRAATASSKQMHRPAFARRIELPVLVILAGGDNVVSNSAMRRFASWLRDGELVELPGARHELLREHDRHRLPLWAAVDRFLAVLP